MSFSDKFVKAAQRVLPSPFTLAIIITFVTAILALFLTKGSGKGNYLWEIAGFWQKGFWELLAFTLQMMMILVLGHVLALTPIVNRGINFMLRYVKSSASAAMLVCLLTLIMAFINWGLGLVFGAIFARKVGEFAKANDININYPLIGAAGYSGLMVWHGGLSGSAPITVSGNEHSLVNQIGVISTDLTIFSSMNIAVTIMLLLALPTLMYFIGKKSIATHKNRLPDYKAPQTNLVNHELFGAERLDHSRPLALLTAAVFIIISWVWISETGGQLSLNFINFTLFGLGIWLHGSFYKFTQACETAITSSTGIMIQFPLYAGIMGIMKYSGLIGVFSDYFVAISNNFTFPFFTFISAGIVNIFVPSGGGQWVVQGPIIVEAAQQLGTSIPKSIMALAYGDQITNMLQPFWALPLLGITGLKAQQILPYCLALMLAGIVIFFIGLAVF